MKKKIFVVALAVCLLAVSIVGSSMAYFTDTEQYTNVFTAGKVDITLTVAGNGTDANIYPGQTISKNATITNVGSEDAYVAAIIKLTDTDGNLLSVVNKAGSDNNIPVAIEKFLTKLGADGYMKSIVVESGAITIYLIKDEKLVANSNGSMIFENIVIPTDWNHNEVNAFKDVTIDIKAYATQTKGTGFDIAESAIKTAFPAEFGSVTFPNP